MRLEGLGAAAPHLHEDFSLDAVRVPRDWLRLIVTAVTVTVALVAVVLLGGWR